MINATEARLRSDASKEKLFNSELNNIQNEIENLGYYVETYTQYNETCYKINW